MHRIRSRRIGEAQSEQSELLPSFHINLSETMLDPNAHIRDFIEYYCTMPSAPRYAVLLKGNWGVGKTWFVQDVLKELEDNSIRPLYISLYGLASYDDIDNAIFKQLHPILSSKTAILGSRIAKGLLKTTLKIDLTEDKKSGAALNVQSQIPDINLPDYLTNTEGRILVFDDLERCTMDSLSVLGYINHFIEHQDRKVLIIANEEEIQPRDNTDSQSIYRRIKEKVIGKIFSITPYPIQAIETFLTELKNPEVVSFCRIHIHHIVEIYEASSYQNLRHLRQALLDFERLYIHFPTEAQQISELLLELLRIYLILSFEVKSGEMTPENIEELKEEYIRHLIRSNSNETDDKSQYRRLSKKYPQVVFQNLLLEFSTWRQIIGDGTINTKEIAASLLRSRYLHLNEEPSWRRLWYWSDLSDNDFKCFLKTVIDEFETGKYDSIPVITHIVGILLNLADRGLYQKSKDDILETAKRIVVKLRTNDKLPRSTEFGPVFQREESWDGLGFQGRELTEFKVFWNYTLDQLRQAIVDNYPTIAEGILDDMESNFGSFYGKLAFTGSRDAEYCRTPILQEISASDFIDVFMKITPELRRAVCRVLSKRYDYKNFNLELVSEASWLAEVIQLLEVKARTLDGELSGYLLKNSLIPEFINIQNKLSGIEEDPVAASGE